MFNIGKVTVPSRLMLAPLSGCSDLAYRLIAREHGAKFCFFEMIDAHSVIHINKRSSAMLKTTPEDKPIAIQILGNEPDLMTAAGHKALEIAPNSSFIDINSACPVKKVTRKCAGAWFLKEPAGLYKIVEKMASSLPVPITLKFRIGYESIQTEKMVEIARTCESAGAAAIFVHGRTRAQGYSGTVDYETIRAMKAALKIPLIGSGNVFTPELARKMFDDTGCDAVLLARGSFGKPWMFRTIQHYLDTGEILPKPDLAEIKEILLRHIRYIQMYREPGNRNNLGLMKKISIWYLRGHNIRRRLSAAPTFEDLIKLVEDHRPETERLEALPENPEAEFAGVGE